MNNLVLEITVFRLTSRVEADFKIRIRQLEFLLNLHHILLSNRKLRAHLGQTHC